MRYATAAQLGPLQHGRRAALPLLQATLLAFVLQQEHTRGGADRDGA